MTSFKQAISQTNTNNLYDMLSAFCLQSLIIPIGFEANF